MRKFITKTTVAVLLGATAVSMTGCYGSFALTSKLHDWNGQVSQKKFVNELVFLGLCILPAYELTVLGDELIFNSIEFWGEKNPIAMKSGEVEESTILHEGQIYKITKSKNNMSVAYQDVQVDFQYFPKEKDWYQMNGETKIKVVDLKKDKVFTYLPNNKTMVFDQANIDQVESQIMANR